MTDTAIHGPDWSKVSKFAAEHWPYLVVGGVVLIGLVWTLGRGTSSGGSTQPAPQAASQPIVSRSSSGGPDPTQAYLANVRAGVDTYMAQLRATTAARSDDASLIAAQIGAATQDTLAQIAANAQIQRSNAGAASAAYTAGVTAQASTANVASATLAGQNIQALQSLTTGFSNFVAGMAQTSAADAAAAAGVLNSSAGVRNQAISSAIGAAGQMGAAINRAGWQNLNGAFTGPYNLMPNLSSATSTLRASGGAGSYIDSGTWDVNP